MFCLKLICARVANEVCTKTRTSALAFLPSQVILPCRYCAWRVGEARTARSSGCASKSVGTRKSSSYLARWLATAGLQLAAVMMMCTQIIQHCTRGRFVPILALWRASCSYRSATASLIIVRNAASFFVHFVGVRFCGGWCSHIFSGLIGLPIEVIKRGGST